MKPHIEQLAAFMIRNSFATGHGDTFADLLAELEWQVKERTDALKSIAANTCCDSCREAALVAKAALSKAEVSVHPIARCMLDLQERMAASKAEGQP